MNRRELLKASAVMSVNHKHAWNLFKTEPSTKYVVFFDPMLVGPDFAKRTTACPPGTAFYSVDVSSGKATDDAIRIYRETGGD